MNTPLIKHIEWIDDAAAPEAGHLRLLDQTKLPNEIVWLDCKTVADVWHAIQRLSVRGAPAIGIAAAYGCVIALNEGDFDKLTEYLATSRPTAVNLFWAIERMKRVKPRSPQTLLSEAHTIYEEDKAMCRAIGEHALPLIQSVGGILTHCNAGALATGGIGTATAPLYLAHEKGIPLQVYADETRPLLQGARLTAYELGRAGIDVTLICDNMAAQLMRKGSIGAIITGADRIAADGDVANKIGTYSLAVLAKHHHLSFYIAAPSSTFDLSLPTGSDIPIEQREHKEVTGPFELPAQVNIDNPAFDVTPHCLITAIITERGVIQPVNTQNVAAMLQRPTRPFHQPAQRPHRPHNTHDK